MLTRLPDYWFSVVGKTQRRSVTLDSSGGPVTTYADFLTNLPMRLVSKGGGESGGQSRLTTQSPVTIYVQNAPDIVATDRIVCSGDVYDIQSVYNPDEADVYLIIGCTIVEPSGVGA